MKPLYPHQEAAITSLRNALKSGYRRPMLQLPCGAGKTRIASEIVKSALAKGNATTFTVPTIELIDQTVRAFGEHGVLNIGVIQAQHVLTNAECPVQVASIDTLNRRALLPTSRLVIVDEAHRRSKLFPRWMGDEAWASVPFIGLSATPWALGLGRLYDTLIIPATTASLIEEGLLAPFKVFAPSHPDLTGVRTLADDYHEGDLSKAMDKRELVADVVTTWLAKADGQATLVFAVDRAHAKSLQAQFQAAGVNAGYIDALTESSERRALRRAFHDGSMPVVCNVGVLILGADWDVRVISFCRPTRSEQLFVQAIGRGLRPRYPEGFDPHGKTPAERKEAMASGPKPWLTILDHSDSTLKLGFVTDIHHDKLSQAELGDAFEPTPRERLPRECPRCSFVLPPQAKTCPQCGAIQRSRQSDVVHRAGELVELDERRATKAAEKRNRDDDWITKISFIAQVRAYARDRNKSDGWVAWRYKQRYGSFPNDARVRYAKAAPECGLEVLSWLTAMNLRWAKAQEKQRKQQRFAAR
jgi:superfamily II DNA or RNA helicase